MKNSLGKLMVWKGRIQSHVTLFNFVMVFYLFIIEEPLGIEWYIWMIILIIGIPVILYLDIRFIFPGLLEYGLTKNPLWMDMKKKVDYLYKQSRGKHD